jgi:hypothetical protein
MLGSGSVDIFLPVLDAELVREGLGARYSTLGYSCLSLLIFGKCQKIAFNLVYVPVFILYAQ